MKEQLISFETAQLAKEKGFDVICRDFSIVGDGRDTRTLYIPTQSLLQKWLWKTHGIWVEVTLWGDGIGFTCIVKQIDGKEDDNSTIVKMVGRAELMACGDPEEALEKGLIEALRKIEL